MDNLDNFKVGDMVRVTNIKTKNFEIGILLEFTKQSCVIDLIPANYKIEIFYKNFIKIEKIEV